MLELLFPVSRFLFSAPSLVLVFEGRNLAEDTHADVFADYPAIFAAAAGVVATPAFSSLPSHLYAPLQSRGTRGGVTQRNPMRPASPIAASQPGAPRLPQRSRPRQQGRPCSRGRRGRAAAPKAEGGRSPGGGCRGL